MKAILIVLAVMVSALCLAPPASAFAPREDVIWARNASGPITLNGNLNEPSWAQAESMRMVFGQDTGIPGSGWKIESGTTPTDPMSATLKLLVYQNQLYLGIRVRDASVGGSRDFNRFDGLLMSIKDHSSASAPKPPAEYMYAWWYPTLPDPQPPGQMPAFIGLWAELPAGSPRTPIQIENWDAVTVVNGVSNSDAALDTGYTIEMRFNLTPMGYDVTRLEGDVVEWNISIYDCDWNWPQDGSPPMSANRTWWQGPWGNAPVYNEVRVHARPDVTVSSGPVPVLTPEMSLYNAANFPVPQIDGLLSEPVWDPLYTFDMRYGDQEVRETYPSVGPHRAGQYQPPVNGGLAPVLDPGDATVRMFFKGSFLYLGFDVRDQVVQFHPSFDRWDGFLITINDRVARSSDHELLGRRLSFQVGPNGTVTAHDYLLTLIQSGGAQVGLALKPGTTVDTLGLSPDTGYTAEVAINLTFLGYPANLGDGTLFLGLNLLDGDTYNNISVAYGTRTWWFREYENTCCPVWAYMDPLFTTGVEGGPGTEVTILDGVRTFPNPGSRTTIQYALPEESQVVLEVFNLQGGLVERIPLGLRPAGTNEMLYEGQGLSSGIYPYQLQILDPATGAPRATRFGKIILLR